MFITHAEFSKDGFLVMAREGQKTRVIEDAELYNSAGKVSYIIPARERMDKNEAEKRKKGLEADESLRNLGIEFSLAYSSGKYVIHAKGSRSMKEALSHYAFFQAGQSNAIEMVRWQLGFPFPLAEVSGVSGKKVILRNKRAPLEELLSEKKCAIDTEVEGWEDYIKVGDVNLSDEAIFSYLQEKGVNPEKERKSLIQALEEIINKEKKEQIFMIPFLTFGDFGNYLLTIYDIGAETLSVNTDIGNVEVEVIKSGSEREMVAKLNELLNAYDPLIMFGHNIGAYDTLKLRNAGYIPGKDASKPTIKASSGIYKRVQQKGIITIDTAPFSQNYLPQTADNKLITVASQILGIKAEKGISYEELSMLAIEAKLGSKKSARRIAEYAVNDCALHYALGNKILEPVLRISFMLRQNPDNICVASKKNTADDLWREKRFWQLKNLGGNITDEKYRNFDAMQLQKELLMGSASKEQQLGFSEGKELMGKTQESGRGVYDGFLIFPAAIISALENMIVNDGYALDVYRKMHSEKNPDIKIVYALSLAAFLNRPLYELSLLRKGEIGKEMHNPRDSINDFDDYRFGQMYGINFREQQTRTRSISANVKLANDDIFRAMEEFKKHLAKCSIINYSNYFICLADNDYSDEALAALENKGLAINLGKARFLSATKGRFMARVNDYLIAESIDASGKRGYRTPLEHFLIPEFSRLILDRKEDEALSLIIEAAKMLSSGELSENDLSYASKPGKEFFQYSALAHFQERIRNYIRTGAKKGETITQLLETNSQYLDRWFGSQGARGRRLSEGTIGDYILAAFPTISKGKMDSIASGRQLSFF